MLPVDAAGTMDGEYTFDEPIERHDLWVRYAELEEITPRTTYFHGKHLTDGFHRWLKETRRILLRDYHKMLHWTPTNGYYIVHPTQQSVLAANVALRRIQSAAQSGLEKIAQVNDNFLTTDDLRADREYWRGRLQAVLNTLTESESESPEAA